MKIFDTHAHYYDTKFDMTEGGADRILSSDEFKENVCAVINVGTNFESSMAVIEQTKKYPFMYSAVGIHPEDCQQLVGSPEDEVKKIETLIEKERIGGRIVALGEIGYDYYWQPVDKPLQKKYFDLQMCLAEKLDLPVIIHNRDSHGDVFDMICAHPKVKGVIHSCSMSAEMVRELCRRGWYISFSGTVTFKNAERVRHSASAVDIDKLLIETDAPYLAPHPHRGKTNNSVLMRHTSDMLASVHNVTCDEMAKITTENACRLFKIILDQ